MYQPNLWIGVDLPGRPTDQTYGVWSYSSLPPIKIPQIFKHIQTLDDIKKYQSNLIELIPSPTDCYFKIEPSSNAFYYDQQDCVIWFLHSSGFVYVNNNPREIVASSLPEFLARIAMEGMLWFKSNLSDDQVIFDSDETTYLQYLKQS